MKKPGASVQDAGDRVERVLKTSVVDRERSKEKAREKKKKVEFE